MDENFKNDMKKAHKANLIEDWKRATLEEESRMRVSQNHSNEGTECSMSQDDFPDFQTHVQEALNVMNLEKLVSTQMWALDNATCLSH